MADTEIEDAVRTLIRAGSTYDLEALAACYDPSLEIVMIDPQGDAFVFDYNGNLDFFRNRRDAGAPHLDQTVRFLHTVAHEDEGTAVVERRMALTGDEPQRIVFALTLKRRDGSWRVTRETAVITS